jgi:Tfp pilus assembly protein PilN
MLSVNLIPLERRRVRARRLRTRRWAVGLGVWGVLCAGSIALLAGVGRADRASTLAQLDEARRAGELSAERLSTIKARFTQAQRALAAVDAVASHPDWSGLLRLLSAVRGEQAVLTAVALERKPLPAPAPAQGAKPPGQPPKPIMAHRLDLAGVGRSPSAVTDLVVRLEQTGLFSSVQLIETKPRALANTDAVSFRIEALLRDDPAPAKGGRP